MTLLRGTSVLLLGLFTTAAWSTPLLAQTAPQEAPATQPQPAPPPADQGTLGDIIVTAQKRSENLQTVPIAVTAFTAQALESRGLTSVQSLGNLSPSVNLDAGSPFSGSNSVLSAFIRGIGQDDFAFNTDPGVGIYVDGVYLARTIGANSDLLDVERIEILKGPQGTLFGRNSIGGAINIVTRNPSKDFDLHGKVTVGSYDRVDTAGAVDIPIGPGLTSLITFSTKNRQGYQRRIPYPGTFVVDAPFASAGNETHDRQDGENSQTLRGKIRYDDGAFRLTLSGDFSHHDQPSTANTILGEVPSGPFYQLYNTCISLPSTVLAGIGLGNVCGPRAVVGTPLAGANAGGPGQGPRLPYGLAIAQTGNIDTTYATGVNFDKLTTWGAGATLEWDIAPSTMLKSITAYRHLRWSVGIDLDGSSIEHLAASFRTRQQQFSEELQMVGKGLDSRLNYAVGLYYFDEVGGDDGFVTYPSGLLQVNGTNTLTTKAYAAFAHLNFAVTDKFGITLGGRFTHEDKSIIDVQRDSNAFVYKIDNCFPVSEACRVALGFPVAGDPLNFFPAGKFTQSFNVFTPRIGLEYKFTRDVMLYGSYSKGFKSGGWTTRLTAPSLTDPEFGPEHAQTFEVGLKSELLDRHVRLNLSGYTTKYSGIQLNFLRQLSVVVQNAGDARINGVEGELTALLFKDFTISGTVGYIDAHYTRLLPGATGVTLNSALPKTPTWKASFSPEYRHQFGNGAAFRLGTDVSYTSQIYNDVSNTPILRRRPTKIVNLSTGYTLPGGNVELSAGGTNITNERYIVTGADQSTGAGIYYGTYSAPAQWYASVKFKL